MIIAIKRLELKACGQGEKVRTVGGVGRDREGKKRIKVKRKRGKQRATNTVTLTVTLTVTGKVLDLRSAKRSHVGFSSRGLHASLETNACLATTP